MDTRRGVPINVSVNPSDYSGRSIRLGASNNSDIRDKMNQRMREFEEESRRWREQFMSPQPSLIDHNRPRMFVNFPDFPEVGSSFGTGSLRQPPSSNGGSFFGAAPASTMSQTTHKSYIEEDDHGHKRYKMVFEIGDFKPNEIQVRTEGRQLIVKGDREIVSGGSTESKQFNREITLPDFIEPTTVTSYLSDGALTVEAPVVLDRLGYSAAPAASAIRNSPYRDNASPSRFGTSSLRGGANFRSSREDLLNSNASAANNNSNFTTSSSQSQYYNDTPTITVPAPPQHQQSSQSPQIAQYKFNMSEFRPEDISITVTDTSLKIHAVREESDLRGSGKTYREFKREIGLPQGSDVKRLKNSLQPDGTLIIDIPVLDNTSLRPPQSPATAQLNKQFNNFSLNDSGASNNSYSYHNQAASQQQQQQQQQQQSSSFLHSNGHQQPAGVHMNSNNLVEAHNDGKDLRLTFDLAGYKPEDVGIKVVDNNTLRVNAVHIDNTRGNQIHREYTRQYILPDWVQPELLRARMSDNGTLTVEVPLPQHKNSSDRQININR